MLRAASPCAPWKRGRATRQPERLPSGPKIWPGKSSGQNDRLIIVPAVVPVVVTAVVIVVMVVTFDDNHLVDVGHRREGVARLVRLGSLGANGTEADRTRSSAGQSKKFTAHIRIVETTALVSLKQETYPTRHRA